MRHLRADLAGLARDGFTYVVHTFSENDLRFFAGTMREAVAATHEVGLRAVLDPWGVGDVFGGEADTAWVSQFPELRQVRDDGRPLPIACPNHPRFRELMGAWVEAAAATGADALFWDEPHLYIPKWAGDDEARWACRCDACQALFRERHGAPMPAARTAEVEAFRRETVAGFVRYLCAEGRRRGLENQLCLLPDEFAPGAGMGWDEASALADLDVFGTDPYWALVGREPEDFVGGYARRAAELCARAGKRAQIWIQGFKLAAGREEEIARAVRAAAEAGVRDLAFWGYEACHAASSIRCGDAPRAWDVLRRAFRELRG